MKYIFYYFFFNDTATTEIYTLSLHDALPISKNMSAYGYNRKTTPFIAEWSKGATLFTNLQAESNWTTSTTASLMTGKRLWTHMAAHLRGARALKSDIESLPLILKKNGYFNMALVANRHAAVDLLGVDGAFDIVPPLIEFINPSSLFGDDASLGIIDAFLYRIFARKIKDYDWIVNEDFILNKFVSSFLPKVVRPSAPPEKVFNKFLDVLNENPPEPFFAWMHIYPPHDPYLPPEPFRGALNSSSEYRTFKSQQVIKYETVKYLHQFQPYPVGMQPAIDLMRDYYDEYLMYCDKKFEDFIEQLSGGNRLKNTVVILSADHGESFENGYFLHAGPFLYEPVTHIPLIIKKPGRNEGQTINNLVEQVDIPATILDLAGIPKPSWMEGRSLLPLMSGAELPPRPAFSMWLGKNPNQERKIVTGTYAVWEGEYKLIHYLEKDKSLLYNLKQDPGELNNLFEKEAETGQRLLDLIYDNLKKANERIRSGMVITSDSEKK